MRKPTPLPEIDRGDWPFYADSVFAVVGVVAVLLAIGAVIGALFAWPAGMQYGIDTARAEIIEACQCWFNNCKSAIMACKQLNWMK